jgi:amino acid transporter
MTGQDDGRGWWRAMLIQTIVTILFILVFGIGKNAIEKITVATAPYFWLFLAMTVVSLIVSRIRYGQEKFTGTRVPWYPLTPVLFTVACLFMVYQSWSYMLERGLWLPTLLIGLWMIAGVGLSFCLGKPKLPAKTDRGES